MMTIKEFASLCSCNTQTLRYYDKIDLLKPVKVDRGSGYRYYTKSQAIDFVKIKNLQAADFTIDEIKVLLTMSDQQIYEAFDLKMIRAVGLILLGWGIVQVGLSLQSHDPSQRSNGFLTLAGGIIITFAKEILTMITG